MLFLIMISCLEAKPPRKQNLFELDCLRAHNYYRAKEGFGPLRWDSQLTLMAQKWANHLKTQQFKHSFIKGYGESLYKETYGSPSCFAAVSSWYKEKPLYRSGMPYGKGDRHKYGHFTQLIWPTTTHVGCAKYGKGPTQVTVCKYWPPGNIIGTPIFYPRKRRHL